MGKGLNHNSATYSKERDRGQKKKSTFHLKINYIRT